MKNLSPFLLKTLLLWVFLALAIGLQAQESAYQNGVRKGVVKVKFQPAMTSTLSTMKVSTRKNTLTTGIAAFDKVATSVQAKNMRRLFPFNPNPKYEAKLRKHGLHLWYVVEIDEGQDPAAVAKLFSKLPEVSVAEYQMEAVLIPYTVKPYVPVPQTKSIMPFNDQLLPNQWHYSNTGQTGYVGGADINLFKAWEMLGMAGKGNVVVAVIDNGIDVNHEDLKANIWVNAKEKPGTNKDDDGNGYVDDINGYDFIANRGMNMVAKDHGTHVAGTIAAVNNNGIGVSGIAGGTGNGDGVKIMALRAVEGAADIELAFIYAADNGAVICQNSWGWRDPSYYEQSVLDGIDYFIAEAGDYEGSSMKGGIVIFAVGNDNKTGKYWPGCYDNVLAVSSLGPDWTKADYSNWGDWVDVAAPGGDFKKKGTVNGILSTTNGSRYGYLQGTSMACPHVSGIAALMVSSAGKRINNNELWTRLVTGVRYIDDLNPEYAGKLGTGAVDAVLICQPNNGIAPNKITDLTIENVEQEFAEFGWSVPTDQDDGHPVGFYIYHSRAPLDANSIKTIEPIYIGSYAVTGTPVSHTIEKLLGDTHYYIAIQSVDRWGNRSELSNVLDVQTQTGPKIVVGANKLTINITNASASPKDSVNLNIANQKVGTLRWSGSIRNTSTVFSSTFTSLMEDPIISEYDSEISLDHSPSTYATYEPITVVPVEIEKFTPFSKKYSEYDKPNDYIGERRFTLPNSSATKFIVTEASGFNLTQIYFYVSHLKSTGNIIVQVIEGKEIKSGKLIYEHAHSGASDLDKARVTLNLKEHLYFKKGSEFWIIIHVPAGNTNPLGIANEALPEYSDRCFYSSDLGATWISLEKTLAKSTKVWWVEAKSMTAYPGEFITLNPSSGRIVGNSNEDIRVIADASKLINGTYKANLILHSNDVDTPETKVEVEVKVAGNKPNIVYPDVVNYEQVFVGNDRGASIVLVNTGYGRINDLACTLEGPQASSFKIDFNPGSVAARNNATVKVTYKPTAVGASNAKLKISNGSYTYYIQLFGSALEPAKIKLTPVSQTKPSLTIGDTPTATIAVENIGGYPLKYFVSGFDKQGISNSWPDPYHKYGYVVGSTDPNVGPNPIAYSWDDISDSGVDISYDLIEENPNRYIAAPIGFKFPFYSDKYDTLYIARIGFASFDKSVNPVNSPVINNKSQPKSFISLFGCRSFPSYKNSNTRIYYQTFSDRIVVQYDKYQLTKGDPTSEITAQMVLYANGDIRFYYKKIPTAIDELLYLNILIEDWDKEDGILIKEYATNHFTLADNMAIGFDYPGLNIITDITNGSGILAPGATVNMDISFKTDELPEGIMPRYITVVSNDIEKPAINAKVDLDIVAGGSLSYEVEGVALDFGTMYKTFSYNKTFTLRNTGTKLLTVSSFTYLASGRYTITGTATIMPGTQQQYTIAANTSSLGTLQDEIYVTLSNGDVVTIEAEGEVFESPAATADLTPLVETLSMGTTSRHPYSVTNTGLSDLTVSVESSAVWAKFVETGGKPVASHSYRDTRHNKYEPTYTWIDIRETGIRLPHNNKDNESDAKWHEVNNLPFPVTFFGESYSSLLVSDNGIISLSGYKPDTRWGTAELPLPDMGAYIMPMFSRGDFDIKAGGRNFGLFYQFEADKIIISWERFYSIGGSGSTISFQAILYKEGNIKFQYKKHGLVEKQSNVSFVALQKPGTGEVVRMSKYRLLDHNVNLAYLLTPINRYKIPAGEQLTGEIIFDACTHSGVFEAPLSIVSDDPANSLLEKPLKLTVTGVASVNVPAEVNIGTHEAFLGTNSSWKEYTDLFVIKNDGNVPFNIKWAKMSKPTFLNYLVQKMWYTTQGQPSWTSIEEIYKPATVPNRPIDTLKHWLLPGDSLVTQISFTPKVAGEFTSNLILTTDNTDIGDIIIPFKGNAYKPPIMGVDLTPINVSMVKPTDVENRTVDFNNNGGGYELNYRAYIDYKRVKPTPTSTSAQSVVKSMDDDDTSATPLLLSENSKSGGTALKSSTAAPSSVQRYLRYVEGVGDIGTFGLGVRVGAGEYMPRFATKFTAGPDGFTISDVGTWFAAEKQLNGVVHAEIWVGDYVYESVAISSGSTSYAYDKEIAKGSMVNVTLDKEVTIYPNESFWVVFTYPLNIENPQGYQFKTPGPSKTDRYFFEGIVKLPELNPELVWYDAAVQLTDFIPLGANWIMYAAESNTNESGFVRILQSDSNGALEGKLQIGESNSLELEFYGTYAQPGDQLADLVFSSNDSKNPVKRVPLKLYMNDAPDFVSKPQVVQAPEGQTTTADFTVKDADNDAFTLAEVAIPDFVQAQLTGGTISLTVTPGFGDSGSYLAKFVAADAHNVSRELQIQIEVVQVNRSPLSKLGESEVWEYNIVEGSKEYNINDLFEDPDGDSFTFTLVVDNVEIATAAELGSDRFTVTPKAEGTTKLTITATDFYGASKEVSVQLKVFRINHLPVSKLGESEVWEYNIVEGSKEYNINDLFEDPDGDSFTFTLVVDNVEIATAAELGSDSFTVTPKAEGTTKLTITATDVYGASKEVSVQLKVFRINRPPVSKLNEVEVWVYNITEGRKEYNINDIIEDSDGDSFTFTLGVDNADIAVVDKLGEDRFMVTPKAIGTTKLTITATDVYNATDMAIIYLQVNDCISDIIVQKWNFMLLVDNKDGKYKNDGYQWYKNGYAIEGATKQFYSAGTGDNDMLDFRAKYHVRMTAQDGTYVYSCPIAPVKRTDISLKSYPNPVERGANVVLEAQVPDLSSSPLEISIYTLNGVLVKTQESSASHTSIAMPANPGIYLMKVSNNSVEKTFKLIVK